MHPNLPPTTSNSLSMRKIAHAYDPRERLNLRYARNVDHRHVARSDIAFTPLAT